MTKPKHYRYEVFATKGSRVKNGFQWAKMRGKNNVSFGIGYDTFQAAKKQVLSENNQRKVKLPVYKRRGTEYELIG